jgi:hypothetical protein
MRRRRDKAIAAAKQPAATAVRLAHFLGSPFDEHRAALVDAS